MWTAVTQAVPSQYSVKSVKCVYMYIYIYISVYIYTYVIVYTYICTTLNIPNRTVNRQDHAIRPKNLASLYNGDD